LRISLDRFDEAPLVDTAHGKHDGHRHHLALGRFAHWRTGARRDIGVAGCIDDPLREDGFAARFAFSDHAANHSMLHDRGHAQPMQQRRDAGLLHQDVRHPLEHLGVERVT